MVRPTLVYRPMLRRAQIALAALAVAVTTACGGGGGGGDTPPVSPTLVSIEVLPATPSLAKGLAQAFTATGHYTDATTQDLSALATWTSSATGFATMSGAVATGVACRNEDNHRLVRREVRDATLTVTGPALVSIEVLPATPSLAKGLTQAFTATGHYTDATTQDLSALATWTSSATGFATMSGAVATGVAAGTTTITASYGGKSGRRR